MIEGRVPKTVRYGAVGELGDPAARLLALAGFEAVPTQEAALIADLRSGALPLGLFGSPLSAAGRAQIERLTPEAEASGLVDGLVVERGQIVGRATCAEGLMSAMDRAGWDLRDRPVLLFGAGLRTRACAAMLLQRGARHLRFAARSLGQAIDAIDALRGLARSEGALLDLVPLASTPFEEDWTRGLVVNATPIGLDDEDADPLWRFARLGREMCVVDLVHRPMRTALLRRAHRSKGRYLTGMAVCAEQAIRRIELGLAGPIDPALAELLRQAP